jgi:signal transduction histidine kinase
MAELRPPALDEWGLAAALAQCASEFTRRTGTACDASAEPMPRLDANRETVVYRVVQEALNNVAKHARARHVAVHLGVRGETACLEVRDDGVGFEADHAPPDQRHFGLVSMRQRVTAAGGTFTLRSEPGAGTAITVHLPLPAAVPLPARTAR